MLKSCVFIDESGFGINIRPFKVWPEGDASVRVAAFLPEQYYILNATLLIL